MTLKTWMERKNKVVWSSRPAMGCWSVRLGLSYEYRFLTATFYHWEKTHKYRYLLTQICKNTQIQRVILSFWYISPTATFYFKKTHKYRYLLKQIYKNTQIQRVRLSFEYRYPTVTFSHRGPVLVRWRPTQPSKSCKFERRRSRNKCLQQLIHKYTTPQIYSHQRVEPRFDLRTNVLKSYYTNTQIHNNTNTSIILEQMSPSTTSCPQTELDGEIWDPNWKVSSWKIEHHHHWSELAASLINNFKGLGVRMRRGGTSYAKHKSLSYKKHRRISY